MKLLNLLVLILFFVGSLKVFAVAKPQPGTPLPSVKLADEEGGKVAGGTWSSEELSGKLYVLFYVDPDESDLNNDVSEALKAAHLPDDKFGSVAVINMDATWLPNVAISSRLKSKQEEFKKTIYVKDMKKKLVREWGLADDSSDVLLFDAKGALLFYQSGKVSEARIKELTEIIRKNI